MNMILFLLIHYNDLIVEKVILDNQTIASGGNDTFNTSILKSRYTPLGIQGYSIDNASSNGIASSTCVVYMIYTTNSNAYITIHCNHSSPAKIKITWYVLYRFNH